MAQSSTVRNLFFYLVSFIALGFIVGSSVYLLNYVAKVTVFPKADVSYRGTPPPVFFTTSSKGEAAPDTTVQCSPTCSLTDAQRANLTDWQQNYTSWQQQPSASANRSRGLVNALSFFIVALPIFFFFFRTAQRDYHQALQEAVPANGKRPGLTIRSIYFYLVALAAVVMFIISAGGTVNTVLKTWVVKSASTSTAISTPTPKTVAGIDGSATTDTATVQSLLACTSQCKLATDLQAQLTQWQADYAQAQTELQTQPKNDWQRSLALSIPFLLVSLPLFWLHWRTVQKERKVA